MIFLVRAINTPYYGKNSTIVGIGVGAGIWKGYEHFKAKKGKKIE